MIEYELFYLVGESKEHDLEKIKKEVEEIVSKEDGKMLDVEVITRRKMSYEIQKETRGVYVTKRFEIMDRDEREEKDLPTKDVIAGVNRRLLQDRNILRFLITRADELPALGEQKKEDKKTDQMKPVLKKKQTIKEEEKEGAKKKEVKKEEAKEEVKEEAEEKGKKVAQIKKTDKIKEEVSVSEEATKKEKKVVAKKKETKGDDIDKKLDEILNI